MYVRAVVWKKNDLFVSSKTDVANENKQNDSINALLNWFRFFRALVQKW